MSYVMFFGMLLLVDGFLHWFLWTRLVRDPGWGARATAIGTGLTIFFAIATPLGMILSRFLPRAVAQPVASAIFVWMGVAFLLFSVTLTVALAKWILGGAVAMLAKLGEGATEPLDPDRRRVLTQGVALASGAVALGASAVALRSGLGEVELREVNVKLERLPKQLSGLTLVQLSDVHVGPLLGARFIEGLVERANRAKPDAVVITGDLVDGSLDELKSQVEALGRLKSRYGTFFVTGNHEFYSGVEDWLPELTRLGIKVLKNERVILGDSGASIDLAGVDDATSGRFGHGPDLERAVAGRDPDRELIVLAHQPKQIEDAAKAGAGLQLSGHTHGGQIWPFNHLVGLAQPYIAGLYQHDPKTQIYVSRGTGFWGPPMRLAAPAEMTKLVLSST
ncbi:MAG: metallophosphoesterase [Myxococcota bacterium]